MLILISLEFSDELVEDVVDVACSAVDDSLVDVLRVLLFSNGVGIEQGEVAEVELPIALFVHLSLLKAY